MMEKEVTTVPVETLIERVIQIKRVSKVVKGGKRFKLSATVVVGDGKGRVGVAHAKAQEVMVAVRKATEKAKKRMVKVSIGKRTLPHWTEAKFGASKILLKPASPGTGLIACAPVRAVLEAAGVKDALTKSLGSNNPYNLAMATIKALQELRTLEEVARLRNKPISYFVERKEEKEKENEET